MLTRDIQRLALAVVMTISLLYSISVYVRRENSHHDWISYASSDSEAFDPPNDAPQIIPDIPIPLPHPDAAPVDDSDGDEIELQQPPKERNSLPPNDEAIAKPEGDTTGPPQDAVVDT